MVCAGPEVFPILNTGRGQWVWATLHQPLVLSDHRMISIYRAVREALVNCIKHARADYGSVVFNCGQGRARIEIEDNGVGFDPAGMQKGFGLSSLTDRLESIGVSLEIHAVPGNGCRIVIFLAQELFNLEQAAPFQITRITNLRVRTRKTM